MFLSLFLRRALVVFGITPLFFALSAVAADDAPTFNAKTFTLANGLQGVVVENHRVPAVTHMVLYKVGSADDPAGKSGLAHLLEHLMFKGTSKLKEGEFSRIVVRNGGEFDASTSSVYSDYYQTISADKLPMVMKMEADRMRNLRLNGPSVLTERDVVIEERLLRTDSKPMALLSERMLAALWGTSPYGNPVVGWMPELLTLSREDALEFYNRWYRPNNAVLVVSGDVTVEQVEKLAQDIYGKIPRGPEIIRQRPTEQPLTIATRIELRDKKVSQPVWQRYYRAPSPQMGTYRDEAITLDEVAALDLLGVIFGGSSTSRLERSLVVDRKLAAEVGNSYYTHEGLYVLRAVPRPGVSIEQLETAIKDEIAALLRDGVSEQEVEDTKRRLRTQVIYARDGLDGVARIIGRWMASGNPLDRLETMPQDISRLTREQVNSVARKVLREEHSVTGVLLPEALESRSASSL